MNHTSKKIARNAVTIAILAAGLIWVCATFSIWAM